MPQSSATPPPERAARAPSVRAIRSTAAVHRAKESSRWKDLSGFRKAGIEAAARAIMVLVHQAVSYRKVIVTMVQKLPEKSFAVTENR